MSLEENLEGLFVKIPALKIILKKLNEGGIKYGLYAGAYVSLITSNRVPTDVDLLINDEDFGKLKELFTDGLIIEKDFGLFYYLDVDRKIEFMSKATVKIDSSQYIFRLTEKAWDKTTLIKGNDYEIRLCDPVDTILLKSMLQRGSDQGKSDISDIEALLKVVNIDREYLEKRLTESSADQRVILLLEQFNLVS